MQFRTFAYSNHKHKKNTQQNVLATVNHRPFKIGNEFLRVIRKYIHTEGGGWVGLCQKSTNVDMEER